MAVRIEGTDAFQALAARLERAASSDVFIETVGTALDGLAPQLVAAVKVGAQRLPKSGGLAALVASTPITKKTVKRRGVRSMRLVAVPGKVKRPDSLNRGMARHFTFGNLPLHLQRVPPGWFTAPLLLARPKVRAAVDKALKDALGKV